MNSSSCRYGNYSRLLPAFAGVMVMLAMLQSSPAASQPTGAAVTGGAAPEVTALWQAHDLQFHYFGFRTYYSCTGLEDRLKVILRELGANADVHVMVSGCLGLNDVSKMLSARIRVRMPTAEGEAVTGSFAATSKAVNLTTVRRGSTSSGNECELLEQVRDQLLPALKIQLVKDDLHCIPGQPSLITRGLQVQALIAADGQQ